MWRLGFWTRGGHGFIKKSKKEGVAGQGSLAYCRSLIFAPYAMADFSPPSLFSPTSAKTDVADTGSVIINHGEVSFPVVDSKVVPRTYVNVDPNPEGDTTNTAVPPPPDSEPEKRV